MTNKFSSSKFSPEYPYKNHGVIDMWHDTDLHRVVVVAQGEFNESCIVSHGRCYEAMLAESPLPKRYTTLYILKESMMMGPVAIQEIKILIEKYVASRHVPVATALVADDSVEGVGLFLPQILKLFFETRPLQTFTKRSEAESWLDAEMLKVEQG